jgi:hypothetical protein
MENNKAEIADFMEDNLNYKTDQFEESTVSFGGHHAVMAMRQEQMEAEHTLKPELESALANLEKAETTRWAIQDKLATITHDRDLLLTRIEVLEQV